MRGSCTGVEDCKLTMNEPHQVNAAFTAKFTQVSAGYLHTCAIRSGGQIGCWGAGGPGKSQDPHYGQSKCRGQHGLVPRLRHATHGRHHLRRQRRRGATHATRAVERSATTAGLATGWLLDLVVVRMEEEVPALRQPEEEEHG